jgi:CheY-like chemotaxis protein
MGPHLLLTVTDSGTGSPKDVIDRIFDPFFTTKAQGQGTGLGLATTLGIIRSCGGDIMVYSEPGVGTKFSILLPVSKLPNASIAEPKLVPQVEIGKGETVLIVDDESLFLETARETLEAQHYRVLTASSGTHAVQMYQDSGRDIDLILLDMMMPGMDGFDTKDAIRGIDCRAKIIASSGLRRPASDGGRLQDFDVFLPKPYTDEKLLNLVRQVPDKTRSIVG